MKGASLEPWEWTAERELAAQLVANGQLTGEEICGQLSVQRVQLQRWKRIPEFRLRMHEHPAEARKANLKYTLTQEG